MHKKSDRKGRPDPRLDISRWLHPITRPHGDGRRHLSPTGIQRRFFAPTYSARARYVGELPEETTSILQGTKIGDPFSDALGGIPGSSRFRFHDRYNRGRLSVPYPTSSTYPRPIRLPSRPVISTAPSQ